MYVFLALSLLTMILHLSCSQAPRPLVRSHVIQFHPRYVAARPAPIVIPPPLVHQIPRARQRVFSPRDIAVFALSGILTVSGVVALWCIKTSNTLLSYISPWYTESGSYHL